jgi:galactokinase
VSRFTAPGRVNLIGEHTDTTGGLVLPIAIDLGITIEGAAVGGRIDLSSAGHVQPVVIEPPLHAIPPAVPEWGRLIAALVVDVVPPRGIIGTITATLPEGAGLSSSAALTTAAALALGLGTDPTDLARLARRAEHLATGVPCGIMDQLAVAAGCAGHALLIDCHAERYDQVALPAGLGITVIHSGQHRRLSTTAYADRVAELHEIEAQIGPLRSARTADLQQLDDETLRRRARHVITENGRVREAVRTLADRDLEAFGELVDDSHRSLRDDFEVSTPTVDAVVEAARARPGVIGARLTGAGFGGCVVVVHEPEVDLADLRIGGAEFVQWRVEAADGAWERLYGQPGQRG